MLAVCSLGEVAYYSNCSSIHSFDYSDYSARLGPDSSSEGVTPILTLVLVLIFVLTLIKS